jgi:hypothetical protein
MCIRHLPLFWNEGRETKPVNHRFIADSSSEADVGENRQVPYAGDPSRDFWSWHDGVEPGGFFAYPHDPFFHHPPFLYGYYPYLAYPGYDYPYYWDYPAVL